jgi:hypothetical protein
VTFGTRITVAPSANATFVQFVPQFMPVGIEVTLPTELFPALVMDRYRFVPMGLLTPAALFEGFGSTTLPGGAMLAVFVRYAPVPTVPDNE